MLTPTPPPPTSIQQREQNDKIPLMITKFESEKQQQPQQSVSNGRRKVDEITGNAPLDIGALKKRDKQPVAALPLPSIASCEDSEKESNKLKLNAATVSIDPDVKEFCDSSGKSQRNFCSGNPSNIYGESGRGPGGISFLGSWALRTCKEEGIMTTQGGVGNVGAPPRTGTQKINPSTSGNGEGIREWYFETGTSFKFRFNHLTKIFFALILVVIFISVVFHNRIRSLENERSALIHELHQMRMHLDRVAERMEAVASEAIPLRSERIYLNSGGSQDDDEGRVKRSARVEPRSSPSRTTKELQYSPATMTYNILNNGSAPFDGLEKWNADMTSSKNSLKEPRAAYLEIDGRNVNIKESRQLIGPWYLPEVGNEIGFNDHWYKNLELDANGTSIVFQEDGLFLIYAQIYYQQKPAAKPTPMGYRIHLRKRRNGRRPVTRTIAECVPSYPATFFQTCFTQVAWFVEEKDEVYLEHFTDSLPMIEAIKNGQTFLGIVRLSY